MSRGGVNRCGWNRSTVKFTFRPAPYNTISTDVRLVSTEQNHPLYGPLPNSLRFHSVFGVEIDYQAAFILLLSCPFVRNVHSSYIMILSSSNYIFTRFLAGSQLSLLFSISRFINLPFNNKVPNCFHSCRIAGSFQGISP